MVRWARYFLLLAALVGPERLLAQAADEAPAASVDAQRAAPLPAPVASPEASTWLSQIRSQATELPATELPTTELPGAQTAQKAAPLPPLAPPEPSEARGGSSTADMPALKPLVTIGGSLGVVLGLFFLFAWTMRRTSPKGIQALPGGVVEVLGRSPLTARQHLHLVRCGRKLLLLCISPDSVETLTEIAQPEEVDYLLGLCQQGHASSATTAFRQALRQYAQEAAEPARIRGRQV